MPQSFDISIEITNGVISCGGSGGSLVAGNNDTIRWHSDADFVLAFTNLRDHTAAWPFAPPRPEFPTRDFTATVAIGPHVDPINKPVYYKYTITVGKLSLDPIVIVDH